MRTPGYDVIIGGCMKNSVSPYLNSQIHYLLMDEIICEENEYGNISILSHHHVGYILSNL